MSRANFQAIEEYCFTKSEPLKVPLFVGIGEDENVTLEQAKSSGKESIFNLEVKIFPGNYFFIFDNKKLVANFLTKNINHYQRFTCV
ncbi:hypothetical protein [Marivirga harenae]|uniref:hypothetical protein n=1 Tax=Marivirga harenae TaxID=2010992 RepID=UPI0026E0E5A5|nr:hypothetical protein [Marivirga harenae]WKV10581.1 hypothetical protein Q3Y49_10180 [Marivirga harenae]|tara:strand:+ start:548168 stop:548428 length:261 start_codon:yes stop_codon:yes gene_type:complete